MARTLTTRKRAAWIGALALGALFNAANGTIVNCSPAPPAPSPASSAADAIQADVVEPQILFADGRLAACGVRATFTMPTSAVVATIKLRRVNDAGEWAVTIRGAPGSEPGLPPQTLHLTTASRDTLQTFSKPRSDSAGGFEVHGTLQGLDGSTFIQDIMLQGAAIGVVDYAGNRTTFAIEGPLSQNVRSSYLMCAGDLFR